MHLVRCILLRTTSCRLLFRRRHATILLQQLLCGVVLCCSFKLFNRSISVFLKAIRLSLKFRYAVTVDCLDSGPYKVDTVDTVIRLLLLESLYWYSLHDRSSK